MKINNKLVAAVLAGALSAPAAFAAQDTSGMHYTSASEGFYASIRVQYETQDEKKSSSGNLGNSASRFGVSGTNDLGGGLEGFYTYEAGVDTANSGELSTRLGHVGLRGGFGEVRVGSFWTNAYNWTYGSTDVANHGSGNLTYNDALPARASHSLQYTTPDLNGFQAAILAKMDRSIDGEGEIEASTPEVITKTPTHTYQVQREIRPTGRTIVVGTGSAAVTNQVYVTVDVTLTTSASRGDIGSINNVDPASVTLTDLDQSMTITAAVTTLEGTITPAAINNPVDDNDLDQLILSARYSINGLSVAGMYGIEYDKLQTGATVRNRDDLSTYAVKVGYAQDNWYVNAWYSENDASDATGVEEDLERFSIAGGVSVDKVALYAVFEAREQKDERSFATLGAQYNLGARSRVWLEYEGRDFDDSDDDEDNFNVGMRHDF